jgi:paraquat-inducible protein A
VAIETDGAQIVKGSKLVACHECDLIHYLQPLPEGTVAKCTRCGAVLERHKRNSIDRTLSFAIAGFILIVLANTFPFLAMKSEGLVQETTLITGVKETTLITGVKELYDQEMYLLAGLVFLTVILVPMIYIAGILYLVTPLKRGHLPWKLPVIFRFLQSIGPWGMMEVFMLGILVSMVKLAKMASVVPGISLYAFVALIFALAATSASLDHYEIWQRLEKTS